MNAKGIVSKYRIHTDAIREHLIPPELTQDQIFFKYANEADMLRELAVKQMETLSMVSMDGIKQLPGGDSEK